MGDWDTAWLMKGRGRAKARGKPKIEEADPKSPGLYLVSHASGAPASWAFRYRNPSKLKNGKAVPAKLTLGPLDIFRTLEPGETPQLGDPLTRTMAQELAAICKRLVKQKIDPSVHLARVAREADIALNQPVQGSTVDALFVKFMRSYPLVKEREARGSTKRQTALFLGLKPDGKGGWEPTGNGVLGDWTGKVFARHDGTALLTRKDAFAVLESKKPVAANRTLTALKLFGRWAEEHEYVSVNPFATMRKLHAEYPGERTLYCIDDDDIEHAEEIVALWQAIEEAASEGKAIGYPYGRIAQLVLLTGQRPGEVREAPWSEFHPDIKPLLARIRAEGIGGNGVELEAIPQSVRTWKLPRERAKNGREHKIPLSSQVLRVLAGLPERQHYLFSAEGATKPVHKQSRVKAALDELVVAKLGRPMESWTVHDLRRTCATGLAVLGTAPHVIDAVQNHVPPRMQKTYIQHDYAEEKRKALEAWGAKVHELVSKGRAGSGLE